MKRLDVVRVALVAAWAWACASTAFAGQPVELRPQLAASGSITLGDLFDNAGAAGSVIVGNGAPPGLSAVLDAGAVQRIARGHGLDWDNPSSLQRIVVPSVGAATAGPAAMTEVLTYSRSLAAGDVVQPSDLIFAEVPRFTVPADAPRDADGVIGKMARGPLRAGAAVAAHDLTAPLIIKRDDIVEVGYHADGISLSLQGKAMADAAAGQPVAVQNMTSKKVIQAVATGPDQAVVGPEAEAILAATRLAPSQFAALP